MYVDVSCMYPVILSRSNINEQHLVKWHLKWQVSNKWQVRAKNVILRNKQEYLLRSCVRVPITSCFPIYSQLSIAVY